MGKNVGDSVKDGLVITATTTRIFFVLKVLKPPKAPLDAMDITKLTGGIGALVKDYAVYKK